MVSRFQLLSLILTGLVVLTGPALPSTAARAEESPKSLGALNIIDHERMQSVIDDASIALGVPGSLVLLRTPQGEFVFPYGTTELGSQSPPTAGTHYRIASNTKTMTAAVILQLAQEGKLSLQEPIGNYVPNVPGGDKITISQLLTMRSGLANYTNSPELADLMDLRPEKAWTPAEVLALAFSQGPNFLPGAQFEYCNTNYALLGLVIVKVEGNGLSETYQSRLFEPLGLKGTLIPAVTSTSLPDPFSHGYMYGGSAYALIDEPYPEELKAQALSGKLPPHDYTFQNASYATAAGGAISTATDQADWIEALVEGRVLNAEWQKKLLHDLWPQNPSQPEGQQYGYGITRLHWAGNQIYFHGGELPGFNSFIGHDPDHDVTLIIWTNLTLSLEGQTTANSLMLKVLDQLYRDSPLKPH